MQTLKLSYGFKSRTESFFNQFDLSNPAQCYDMVNSEIKKLDWNISKPDIQMRDKVAIATARHNGTFEVLKVDKSKKGMFDYFNFTLKF